MKALKIYVAGPYSAATAAGLIENTNRAVEAGLKLFKKGHFPFVPHLTHYVDLLAQQKGIPMAWEEYLMWDKPWLEDCDAVLLLAPSRGALLELEHAKRLGLRIFNNLDEIPDVPRSVQNPFLGT